MSTTFRREDGDLSHFLETELLPRLTPEVVFTSPAHQFVKSNGKWRGGCPHHNSKSGTSFNVTTDSLLWYCPTCEVGGGPIQYLQWLKTGGRNREARGVDFVEHVRELARRAGVPFPERELSEKEAAQAAAREGRRSVLAAVAGYAQEVFWTERGEPARQYLAGRGFTEEAQRELGFGFYVSAHEVGEVLQAQSLNMEVARQAGVLWQKLEGFILIPWNDEYGRPLTHYFRWPEKTPPLMKDHPGWQRDYQAALLEWRGRSEQEQEEQPWQEPRVTKTLALPGETTKASPLYLDRARKAGHKELVNVEGVMDAALAQALGDTRVVACVGAQLSNDQAKTLARQQVASVTLCLDPDAGGDSGIRSCIKSLDAYNIRPLVAPRLPDGTDPDEFILSAGIDGWRKHLDGAVHAYRYQAQQLVSKHQVGGSWTDAAMTRLADEAAAYAASIPPGPKRLDLDRFFWPEIAAATGIESEALKIHTASAAGGRHYSAADIPGIRADNGDLAQMAVEAWEALQAANEPPFLFRSAGQPVRLVRNDHGYLYPESLTLDRTRHHLARIARWYRVVKIKEEEVEVPAHPPIAVVKDVLAAPEMPLPVLSRIVRAPVFGPSGVLQTSAGYHADGQVYYDPRPGFVVPPVSPYPTQQEIEKACGLIRDDLLGDFPFTGDPELAHAIALLLLPFARSLIDGLTPLHLIEKPEAGTGAGLLVDVLLLPALGGGPSVMVAGRDEDEWRKRITSTLIGAPTAVLIDNLRHTLDSGVFSAVLTAEEGWEDRLLGLSANIRLVVNCVWVATANNPSLSKEIARRRIRIRMDAGVEHPELRTGFKHDPLKDWVKENRGLLVWAALTLIQAWLAAGRPRGDKTLGRLEQWAAVMGGTLQVAGIKGFLGNLEEANAASDVESASWRAFVWAWKTGIPDPSKDVLVKDLWPIATKLDEPLGLGDGSEHSQRIRLGKLLGRLRGRRFSFGEEGGERITLTVQSGKVAHGAVTWKLAGETPPASSDAAPPAADDGNERKTLPTLPIGECGDAGAETLPPHTPLGSDPYSVPDDPFEGECGECGECFTSPIHARAGGEHTPSTAVVEDTPHTHTLPPLPLVVEDPRSASSAFGQPSPSLAVYHLAREAGWPLVMPLGRPVGGSDRAWWQFTQKAEPAALVEAESELRSLTEPEG